MRALRILVVDDEQLAREELCFLLGAGRRRRDRRPGRRRRRGPAAGRRAEARRRVSRRADARPDRLRGRAPADRGRRAAAARVRHRLRPVRHRRVLGERGRLPAEAGRRRPARADARTRAGAGWRPRRPPSCRSRPADLEKVIEAVQARQGRRDQLAIRVGERFILVQAEEVVHASLVDEAIVVATNTVSGHV